MTQRRHFGSTRKLSSGRWQARYFDAAGTRHNAPRTFASKTDALQWLSTVDADLARGDWHDPKLAATSFAAWVERWRPTTANLRPSTRDLYEYLLRVHLLPTFGSRALGKITTVDVQAWLVDRRNAGLSATSVAKAYRLLARILRPRSNRATSPRTRARSGARAPNARPRWRSRRPSRSRCSPT